MISFTIPLPPITKKNSQRILINKKTNKPFIAPSKQFKEYEEACGYFIKGKGEKIDYPVTVRCVYYMPTKRRVDLTNLLEATHDILVKYEVLADDNPRTEVEIL